MGNKRTETLAWFTERMKAKLDANRDKGDNWDEMGFVWLFRRLGEERDELATALIHRDLHSIIKESADIANFAMMIADTARHELEGK